ncbi:porin family protein [Yoonia sp. BS5-3]|uniref:Porin family protein n=1 Tax=Yoonia phaeophyticola TaxID=3137369 RepID=A0ABZ2V105_9RHOB
MSILKPLTLACAALLPTTVFADWSGGYAGLNFGTTTGDLDFFDTDVAQELDDGTTVGVFAGYQVQSGAFVYGGEVAIFNTSDAFVTGFSESEISEPMFDFKARGGYTIDDVLLYGLLGMSSGIYTNLPDDEWDVSGLNYGIGAEYIIGDKFVVGAEYLVRDLEGDNPDGGGQTVQIDFDTLSFRASYKF